MTQWQRWVIVVCAGFVALWFVTDGTIALVSGDYVTPKTGEYAGQLASWSKVVSSVGIEPRSLLMKCIFVSYGALWLAVIVSYVVGMRLSRALMLVTALGSLWYLPFGTVLGIIQIGFLIWTRNIHTITG